MPDGWDVRSEHLAGQSPDGQAAVLSGLKELRVCGYLRLERRRLLDGTFTMGTAVSETPVEAWVEQSAEYDGKAVAVVEQRYGSFRVLRKDGALVDDGFDAPPLPLEEQGSDEGTGSRFPASGRPASGLAASGLAESGQPPATKGDRGGENLEGSEDSLRSSSAAAPKRRTIRQRMGDQSTVEWQVTDAYWQSLVPKPIGAQAYPALFSLVCGALDGGYSPQEVEAALRHLGGVPSVRGMDLTLRRVRAGESLSHGRSRTEADRLERERRQRAWDEKARRAMEMQAHDEQRAAFAAQRGLPQ